MLIPNDIADRLEVLAAEKFPGEKIYRELLPQGYTRPCTLIVQEPWEVDAGFGTGQVWLRPVFTLTTFVEVDEYHHSHMAPIHLRQMTLLGLLLPGYIKAGGRAPKVEKIKLAGGYDYGTVTVMFGYALSREDFMELEQAPLMSQLHLRTEEEE